MADSDIGVLDRKTFNLIAAVVRAEMGAVKNRLISETVDSAPPSMSPRWVPFINPSSDTIPAYAIMAVSTDSVFDSDAGQSILKVSKPSTVFCRVYAVNSSLDSTGFGGGVCYLSGPVQVLYEGSFTPAVGKYGGPKPDSWALNEGWPSVVDFFGTVDTTTKIAHGFLHSIRTVVAKTTSAIAAVSTAGAPGTGTAVIWTLNGSTFAESSPRQSFTGYNFSTVASSTVDLYGFTERDGVFCMDAPASAGGGGSWRATLATALTVSTTSVSVNAVVLMSDGSSASITSAANPWGLAASTSQFVKLERDLTTSAGYSITQVTHTASTIVVDVATTGGNTLVGQKRSIALMFNDTGSTQFTIDAGTTC